MDGRRRCVIRNTKEEARVVLRRSCQVDVSCVVTLTLSTAWLELGLGFLRRLIDIIDIIVGDHEVCRCVELEGVVECC